MFFRRLLGALIVCALPIPTIADNTLILPTTTRLLVIDGQDASDQSRTRELTLDNGRHQVVFQLRSLVRDGSESDMFTSSPYIMTFDLSGDQTFTVKAPTLRSRRDADNLTRSPNTQITLLNQQGKKTPFEFGVLNRRGLLIGGDIVRDVQEFNRADNPAAMRTGSETAHVAAGNSNKQVLSLSPISAGASSTNQSTSEHMLQYWYNQANEETRARFLRWVAQKQSSES